MRRFQYSHCTAGKATVGNRQRWSFRPSLATTLATVLLLPLLLALGGWQLQRGAQKATLQAQWTAQAALPPLHIGPGDRPDLRAAPGRRLLVRGEWDTRRQILLDNQVVDGLAGYQVYTPLHLADGHAVLVNRGWLPGGARRDAAPDVQLVARAVLVAGNAALPPSPGPLARQATDATLGDGLLRVQQLNVDDLSQRLGLTLEPWTIKNTFMTPTLKLKRNNLMAFFAEAIEGMYQKPGGR